MSWIILIFAGLMEVGFTFCLGKTKTAAGQELALWRVGFLCALALSMFFDGQSGRKASHRYCLPCMDRYRRGRCCGEMRGILPAVSLLPVPTLIDRPTYSESSATPSSDSICDTIKKAARPSMGHAAHYRIAVVSS